MARKEALIVRGEISPAGKPEGRGRRKALFSEIEDSQLKLKLVEEHWRQKLEDQNRKQTAIVDPANEENIRRKRQLVASRNQQAVEEATSRPLGQLIMEHDEMPFALALSRVPKKQRPAVYKTAVTTCIEVVRKLETSEPMRQTLKSLIGLDDTSGHRLSKEAINAIEETDPDMFTKAVQILPASLLALVADENKLGVCSDKQLSTFIRMAAEKIFTGGIGQGTTSEAEAERQQQMRVPMGRLLDTVMERDGSAVSLDDPDFGFAEAVAGQIAARQLERLAKGKPPTFTLCKLVELADRKRESAVALAVLLDPKLVEAARKAITEFGDNQELFDEALPDINTEDYFSIR